MQLVGDFLFRFFRQECVEHAPLCARHRMLGEQQPVAQRHLPVKPFHRTARL